MFRTLRVVTAFLIFSSSFGGLTGCAGHTELLDQTQSLTDKQLFHKNDSVIDHEELWGKPLKLPEVDRYINGIRERLETHTQNSILSIDVLDGSLVNGRIEWGSVDLTRGMLNACHNEAELAAYIGHELGHWQQFYEGNQNKKSFLSKMIDKGLQYVPDQPGPIATAQQEKEDISNARFSQAQEQDADERGAMLAAKCGYNPYAFADLFDRLSLMVTTNPVLYRLAKLKGSHKALDVRAKHLRQFLASKGYKHSGIMGSQRYAKSLASLAAYEKKSEKNSVPPELTSELAGFQREIQEHKNNHQPLAAQRFLQIMSRLSEINRTYPAITDPKMIKPRRHAVAFMQESLFMDAPSWASIDPGVTKAINDILSGLGHLAVAGLPMIGDSIDLYELASGKDFFTGQTFAPPGAGLAVVGLLAGGATLAELGGFLGEAGAAIDGAAAAKVLQEGAAMEQGIEASPTLRQIAQSPDFSPANFYALSNGDLIPATGYRYISSDSGFVQTVQDTGVLPVSNNSGNTYISFDNFTDPATAASKLQLPPQNEAGVKIEFDTLQISDNVQIPTGRMGTPNYLQPEPITQFNPQYGEGGATQAITNQPITVTRMTNIQTGQVLYESPGN